MLSFTFSCRKSFLCCCGRCGEPEELPSGAEIDPAAQEETPDAAEPVPDWPQVPEGVPVSNFAFVRSRTGDNGVFQALARIMARRALEEAVEEVWVADVLGIEVGSGDFAPRGEGNRDMGSVGESGDCVPCSSTDRTQPLLQLPLRRRRGQNVWRMTRILGALDLAIRSLENFSSIRVSHVRERFRRIFRTVEKLDPGLMMAQALVRKGV